MTHDINDKVASHHRRRFKRRRLLLFRRFNVQRGLRVLPNLFTLGNAFFGFCSIVFAASGDFVIAAYFILLGALMDTLDGRVARFVGSTSDLGMQLDSLCDAISFGLAPAFLVYSWQLHKVGFLGFLACALFLLAGLFRLARFNITQEEQTIFFLGVPITLAGCFLVTVLLNAKQIVYQPQSLTLLLSLVIGLAFLMVSTINFPTFKHINKNWYALSLFLFTAFTIVMGFMKVLLLLSIIYFIFAFEEFFRLKIMNLKNKHSK